MYKYGKNVWGNFLYFHRKAGLSMTNNGRMEKPLTSVYLPKMKKKKKNLKRVNGLIMRLKI